jgi:hypothetical protein
VETRRRISALHTVLPTALFTGTVLHATCTVLLAVLLTFTYGSFQAAQQQVPHCCFRTLFYLLFYLLFFFPWCCCTYCFACCFTFCDADAADRLQTASRFEEEQLKFNVFHYY